MNVQPAVAAPRASQALVRYASIPALIAATKPPLPYYALHPARFKCAARRFLDHFPGTTMYAVKVNPAPHVLDQVYEAGIRHFDTASLAEIELIRGRYPDAQCHFMAPVRIPGEAGAAIVLVRDDLVSQPAITIRGFGGSNDANHLTGPSRDGSGLAQAIRVALNSAKLSPNEIDFIHAHGTGTSYNDAMESLALKTIFGGTSPPVSASKGMLGHTLGAAGVIETICCALAMEENFLPGTPRLTVAAEGTPKNLVREPRSGVRLKNVLKLNTGFGGMNGALILSHE